MIWPFRAALLISYEIESSRLKPGCAANAIVNGFLSLIEQRR